MKGTLTGPYVLVTAAPGSNGGLIATKHTKNECYWLVRYQSWTFEICGSAPVKELRKLSLIDRQECTKSIEIFYVTAVQ